MQHSSDVMRQRIIREALVLFSIVVCVGATVSHSQSGWTISRVTSGGRDLNAIYFIDSKRGWIGGDGGFLAVTEDAGASWVERRLGTDRAVNDVYFVSGDHGVALTGGSIFETSDGGHSW